MYDVMDYFQKKNCNMNLLVWCKTNPIPSTNGNWLPDVEYCLVFKELSSPKYNDGYRIKSKWFVSAANKYDKDSYQHPTIKPIEFVKRHILHSTNVGDVVLDPFCGSGTTLKACQETGRNYIGMEIDPRYHQIAVDRLNNINQKGEISLF